MKKIVALILVLGMVFSLVACGSGSDSSSEAPAASEAESSGETAEEETLGGVKVLMEKIRLPY